MSATQKAIPANPAKVEFPRDIWGATTELRRAGLKCAGKINHDPNKLAVYLQTLATLAGHAQARHARAKVDREAQLASIEVEATTED